MNKMLAILWVNVLLAGCAGNMTRAQKARRLEVLFNMERKGTLSKSAKNELKGLWVELQMPPGFKELLKEANRQKDPDKLKSALHEIQLQISVSSENISWMAKDMNKFLRNENKEVRKQAIEIVGKIGSKANAKNLRWIAENEPDIMNRCKAVVAFGLCARENAKEYLRFVLNDINNETILRVHAAESLGNIGDGSGYELAVECLDSKDWMLRQFGIRALGKIGRMESIEVLKEKLTNGEIGDSETRKTILLIELNQYKDLNGKMQLLNEKLKGEDPYLRKMSAWIMIRQMGAEGKKTLESAASDNNNPGNLDAKKVLKRMRIAFGEGGE